MNQFAPLDIPAAMDAFLGYWKPNAVMLMECELWPNLILGAARNGVSYSLSFINILFDMDYFGEEQHELHNP